MILVDTTVWVDHFRGVETRLSPRLSNNEVLTHPFVVGELALGRLPQRRSVLEDLKSLPTALLATDDEVLKFIEDQNLFGWGVGYVDTHLLASVRLTSGSRLWTKDRRLSELAERLGLALNVTN